MLRIVQTASLLVVGVLVGCAGAARSVADPVEVAGPPPSRCTFALDSVFDAAPVDEVYAAVLADEPAVAEALLREVYGSLHADVTDGLHGARADEAASEGSGDAGPSDDDIRALHRRIDELSARPGAPLRVGPTRFYLSEPLAAVGFAAARQRGDDEAALAWLEAGGMGHGDSGRLGACRIAMALGDGSPVDDAWVRAIDPADPALADWMRWLRAAGLAEPADVWARPDGVTP